MYNISFFLDIMIHGGLLMAFAVAAIYFFLMTRYEHKPKRLFYLTASLMALIALQSFEYLVLAFTHGNIGIAEDTALSVMINLLVIPFCYLIMMELTLYRKVTIMLALLHVSVPFLLAIVYYVLLLNNKEIRLFVFGGYLLWVTFAIIRFALPTIRHVSLYNDKIQDFYADVEGRRINWVGRTITIFLIIAVLFLILKVALNDEVSRFVYSVIALWFWMTIAWNVSRMRHRDAVLANEIVEEEIHSAEPTAGAELAMSAEESRKRREELETFMQLLNETLQNGRLYASSELTRDMVAKAMGTNYRFLIKYLKEATGMTFSAYVTELRLEQAVQMLRDTNMTASEVMYACGFESSSTFYRVFVKKYGCTPIEYKKKQA